MARILKSLQSEGGFSVRESTIIDPERNIVDSNSIKIINLLNDSAFKKEFISFATLDNSGTSKFLEPAHTLDRNKIAFINVSAIATWEGYPIGEYVINANESIVTITLSNHGLQTDDNVDISFDNNAIALNGTYPIVYVNNNVFTVDTQIVLNVASPTLGTAQFTNYGIKWDYAVEIKSVIYTDDQADQTLTAGAISKTIIKDNVPPGHQWEIEPNVNNVSKEFSFQASVSSNGTLENFGTGVRWAGNINIITSDRD